MRYLNRWLAPVSCLLVVQLAARVEAGDHDPAAGPTYGEAVSLLDTWVQSIVDYDRIPGASLAIVHDQEVAYSKGFGFTDQDGEVKAAPDTVYGICSIGKIFTGIAVMQLRDAGKLDLDDPVEKHLPWFSPGDLGPESPPPTLGDLLHHTGGLPCEPDRTFWENPEELYPSREDLIERVSTLKMSSPPNTTFNYSNLGYSLLGEVVSTISGMEYGDYVRQHILDPLGLHATTPYMPEAHPDKNVARGYGPRPRTGSRIEIANIAQRALAPASGFASTVEDMAKFAMWQFRVLEGQDASVLKPETLREMYSMQWQDPAWGLGFALWQMGDQTFVGHYGGCFGYQSQLIINPEEKIAAVVMANAWDAPQFTLVFRSYEIMAPVLDGRHSAKAGNSQWAEYAGFYTSDNSWSEAEVLSWNGQLAVMWVPGGNPNPIGSLTKLTRVEDEVFREVRADGKPGKHYIFKRDAEGNVTGLKFNSNLLTRQARPLPEQ